MKYIDSPYYNKESLYEEFNIYVENLLKESGFSKIEKVCEVLSVSMWVVRK